MENSYGIGVANRYALFLDEEEDPLEVLKIQEQEKEAKKKTKHSEKENKVKTVEIKTKSTQARKIVKESQNVKSASLDAGLTKDDSNKLKANAKLSGDRIERNVKFIAESREERNNRRNRDDRLQHSGGEYNRDGPRDMPREGPRETRGPRSDVATGDDRRGRGTGPRGTGGRGRGNRGGPGGRGSYDNRVKREFDRQSGADKPERIHTTEAQLDDWEGHKPAADAPGPMDSTETNTTPAVTEGDAGNPIPTEEEPRELTLDEYKALRSSRQKPTYNLRKAGEGEDLTQWKTMYALTKKKEGEEEEEEDDVEYDVLEYPQRVGRQKHLLNIDIHFADTRRGNRGRGGRGASRGSGSRGSGPRGGGPGRTDDGTRGNRGGATGESRGPSVRGDRGFRGDRGGDRIERAEMHGGRGPRQSAPKVDDEHDFPSLG